MIRYTFAISDKRDHDKPYITEVIFFSHRIWCIVINFNVLEEPLMKHGVLDEASLTVMHGLWHSRQPFMNVMNYVMYRLGKKENGLQIFYHCLREIQDIDNSFVIIVEELEREGLLLAILFDKKQHAHIINHRSPVIANIYIVLSLQHKEEVLIPLPFLDQPQRTQRILYVIQSKKQIIFLQGKEQSSLSDVATSVTRSSVTKYGE